MVQYRKGQIIDLSKDFLFYWEAGTFTAPDSMLSELANNYEIINFCCTDISKQHVDRIFSEIFGYSAMVDPTTFDGQCVQKSDQNFVHDGKIITCPLTKKEEGVVYQKIINNQISDHLVEDIRIPVLKATMPFAYLKRRPICDRFSNTNLSGGVVELTQVISNDEKQKIRAFCNKIGLDCGEVDVLRDRDDQKLYIVDANNTPFGPPNHISFLGYFTALKKYVELVENLLINSNN